MKFSPIRFFVEHPTAANLLMIMMMVVGVVSIGDLRRETYPDYSSGKLEVRVAYPGATAEEVENTICQRLQDAVDGVQNIKETTCESRDSLGFILVEWNENGTFQNLMSDVRTEVEAIDNFPEQSQDPTIKELYTSERVVSIAVTGPMSVPDLKLYAEQLKDRLLRLPEISLVTIDGFSEHQIRIEIPNHILQRYGLSLAEVARIIRQQNVSLPAGDIETRDRDVKIRFLDERYTIREFADLIILNQQGGAVIRLGDIADISDRFEKNEEKILFNGRRAAMLRIRKTKAEDSLTIGAVVKKFVEREQNTAPDTVQIAVTGDYFSVIGERLNLLIENGWQGFVLVVLVLWLFFNIRFSFWVAMGLPVSFLGSLFCMKLFGYSLNMFTMVALLVAIGLLMDDGIVIAENIASQRRKGKSPLEAAIVGLQQVSVGVFSSFLTTICIFAPLMFIAGDVGKILKVIPAVLIITLSVSLLEAFFILPRHMGHSLSNVKPPNKFRLKFEAGIDWLQNEGFGRWIDKAIAHRYLFVSMVVLIFFGSLGLVAGGVVKSETFPELDGNNVQARLLMPQGTPLEKTEVVIRRLTRALDRVNAKLSPLQPEGRSLIKNIEIKYAKNVAAGEYGPHSATILVDLLETEKRHSRITDILQSWRDEIGEQPDVVNITFSKPSVGPAGLPIDIRLLGDDLANLKAASLDLQKHLRSYNGASDIRDDLMTGKPEVRLRLKETALGLGLNAASIAEQLRSAYLGDDAGDIQVAEESYEINIRLPSSDQNSMDDLENFTLTVPGGAQVPLTIVVEITRGQGYSKIKRLNGRRAVTVLGEVNTEILNINELLTDIKQNFMPDFQKRHPDVEVAYYGTTRSGKVTSKSMRRALLIGVVLIFVLLSFQFKSYLEPLVIMMAIPMALIGVILGHWLMAIPISMPSLIGFVSLSGVVVNDSILLLEFLKDSVKAGKDVGKAACQAGRDRFRAILLTSLTTAAGMTPLLFETSMQAQILIPLVCSLVFGIMASTVMVLMVVPALYTIMNDFGLVRKVSDASHG